METSRIGEVEWKMRCDLAAACRLFAHRKWIQDIFGHLSFRDPENSSAYVITPFGMNFCEITPSCLIKVDLEGNVLNQGSTRYKVSHDSLAIHPPIYKARSDVGSIMHCHDPVVIAISCTKEGLLPINQSTFYAHAASESPTGTIPRLDFEGRASIRFVDGKRDTSNLVAVARTSKIVMLNNHGLLTLSPTISESYGLFYYVDEACRMQQLVPGGRQLITPNEEALADIKRDFARKEMAQEVYRLLFEADVRMIRRLYPGFEI